MLISDLQDRLRALARERTDDGELTGTQLAKLAGFQQAHVSNFLNRRRGLSVEAMDRLMEVLRLDVRDLMPEERRRANRKADDGAGFDLIPMVEPGALLKSEFDSSEIIEHLRFRRSYLRRIRLEVAKQRRSWQRFVLIKTDKDSGVAMHPRLMPGAILLIDRHYNSLRNYRRSEPNLYAVKSEKSFLIRYVEEQGDQLTLRPENRKCGLGFVRLGKGGSITDCVVGRVAHISIET